MLQLMSSCHQERKGVFNMCRGKIVTLPQKWDHITSVYIQETEVNDFNLVRIREQIIGEWEHSNEVFSLSHEHHLVPS